MKDIIISVDSTSHKVNFPDEFLGIGYDTLQSQLEYIYNQMLAYKGQTNISQINNDLPFIIDSTALKDLTSL